MCFKRYYEEKEKTSHRKKKIHTNHICDKELVSKTSKFLKLDKTKKHTIKNHTSHKKLVSKAYKFLQLDKTDNINEKWRNTLNRHFNRGIGMLNKHMKISSTILATTETQV